MSAKKQKYYVIWSGEMPGIYTSWEECEQYVKGQKGAKYKSYSTLAEAEEAFRDPMMHGIVPKGQGASGKGQVTSCKLQVASCKLQVASGKAMGAPIYPSIAVDGACSGNPGMMEYQGVNAATKERIFHGGPYPGGTNNIAEYLAIVHALAELNKQADECQITDPARAQRLRHLTIYSDSKTAQAWVRKRQCGTKLAETEQNAILFRLIQRADNWLAVHRYTNPILKWETERWGEIPADFGRK